MGKISSYGIDSTPNLSDKVIGTDVDNLNATKNFTIGQILDLANLDTFVPYTGANANVNLGAFGITANSFVKVGGTSSQFLKANGSVDTNTYALASSLLAYVPYVGATANINLGGNSITANSIIKLGGTSSQFLKADGSVDSNTYALASSITGLVPYTGATANVNLGANNITANSFIKAGGTSSQFLKADGSVDTNTYLTASSIQFTQVLNGISTASQAPSALNTPLTVSFGAAQSNAVISLDAGGKVLFLQAGSYFINAYGSVERQGGSGGVAIVLFRAVLNGTQISATKAFHLDNVDLSIPYEVTIPFEANDGDTLWFEIMRDSSGVNAGGVYPHTNLGGWSNVPSTQIQIWKLN